MSIDFSLFSMNFERKFWNFKHMYPPFTDTQHVVPLCSVSARKRLSPADFALSPPLSPRASKKHPHQAGAFLFVQSQTL